MPNSLIFDPTPLELARVRAGYSYRKLAKKARMPYQRVYQTLKDTTRGEDTILQLCRVLRVPVGQVWKDGRRGR